MKKLLAITSLLASIAFSQDVTTRLPDAFSWQISYQYNQPLMDYLDELASTPINPDAAPADITGKLGAATVKDKEDAGQRKLQSRQIVKNRVHYYERISTQGTDKIKERFIINKNYMFSKKANFPRFIASGKNSFKESVYEDSDFPTLLALDSESYKGDVVYDRELYSLYSIPYANQEIPHSKLVSAWMLSYGVGDEITLPSDDEIKQKLFGDASLSLLVNKRNKRPFIMRTLDKIEIFNYNGKLSFASTACYKLVSLVFQM